MTWCITKIQEDVRQIISWKLTWIPFQNRFEDDFPFTQRWDILVSSRVQMSHKWQQDEKLFNPPSLGPPTATSKPLMMRPKTVCLEAPWKCVGTLVDSILRHDRNNSEAATPPKTNSLPLKNTVCKVTFIHFCGVVLLGQRPTPKFENMPNCTWWKPIQKAVISNVDEELRTASPWEWSICYEPPNIPQVQNNGPSDPNNKKISIVSHL